MNEKIAGILLDALSKIMHNIKNDFQWKKMFVDSKKFFTENPDTLSSFESDLYNVFSNNNLFVLAEELKNENGYSFYVLLHKKLAKLMNDYEIPEEEAEAYIYYFTNELISKLEKEYPIQGIEAFLGGWKAENEKHYNTINAKLDLILNKLSNFENKNKAIFTIDDINKQLSEESIYEKMSLDFFKLDDEQFEAELNKNINKESIFVVGKSREETLYRVLNELKHKYSERLVFVVKSEECWNELVNNDISGYILIPFFYCDAIKSIPNNTNIFIYGEDEPCYRNDKLTLRNRLRYSLADSLNKIGIEYNEANVLLENTHGLYVPLKKRLFNGAIYDKPDWINSHSSVVMSALLCGKWADSDGDKVIFEELACKKYDECMHELDSFLYKENPFIVINKGYSEVSRQLASVEDAWEELDVYINDEMWNRFIVLFHTVLIESEPVFNYPMDKHFEASLFAAKSEWSPMLKSGMIRTLIMHAYYRNHEEKQKQIDHIVNKVLDEITNKSKWAYISQYLPDLCEASPIAVLTKLEKEIKNPTGMFELFTEDNGDIITSRHYYSGIILAIGQLLQQKKYYSRALEVLWNIDDYISQKGKNDQTKNLLESIYCAWINVSLLVGENKIESARNAIKKYKNAWNIIVLELPNKFGSMCSPLNVPKYRKVDEMEEECSREMVNHTYIEYLNMCIETAGINVERWVELLEYLKSYPKDIQENTLNKLVQLCSSITDEAKFCIKNHIREFIYRNRYFKGSEWTLPEEVLVKYEDALNEISFFIEEYDYAYIFYPEYDYPLLNPCTFNKEEKNVYARYINGNLRERDIESKLYEFKKKNLSLEKLIESSVKIEHNVIGDVLAQFYSNKSFDKNIFSLLVKNVENSDYAYSYVRYLDRNGSINLIDIIAYTKEITNNNVLLAKLISLEVLESNSDALVFKENEEIKKIYWSSYCKINISESATEDICLLALEECFKYGALYTYVGLLSDVKDIISVEEFYKNALAIRYIKDNKLGSLGDHYFKEILSVLHEKYLDNENKCEELASLELYFRNVLDWEHMKCLQRLMKRKPEYYAQLVKIVFKSESTEEINEEKKQMASELYGMFEKALFCPAELDGKVEYDRLKNWFDNFKELLVNQKQYFLFDFFIGRLFAYSPLGQDGYSPCESVRAIIEDCGTEKMKNSYVIAEQNKRGVYNFSAGKSELELSERYRINAEYLASKYPHTADIYYTLSDSYKRQAKHEREHAEND